MKHKLRVIKFTHFEVGRLGGDYVIQMKPRWMESVALWKRLREVPPFSAKWGQNRQTSPRTPNLWAPWYWTSKSPELRETRFCYLYTIWSVVFCYSSHTDWSRSRKRQSMTSGVEGSFLWALNTTFFSVLSFHLRGKPADQIFSDTVAN